MQIERFNLKAQDAIERALGHAMKHGHRFAMPVHLLAGLLEQDDHVAKKYLENAKCSLGKLTEEIKGDMAKLERLASGDQEMEIGPELEAVFTKADFIAANAESKYIGQNHMLQALLFDPRTGQILEASEAQKPALEAALVSDKTGLYKAEGGGEELQFLPKYAKDLTELARAGKLDPVLSRDKEIREAMQILSRRLKNNPIIIGEPGVGKTAIIEGLAQRIVLGDVPSNLKDHAIYALDMGMLVAGTKFRGEFEERFKGLLDEVMNAGNVLLFIDEIHMLIGAGGQEGAMDASNLLKPALSRGQLRCIGATTMNEYRKKIEPDNALVRRFQPVIAEEPTVEQTIQILRGLREKYEVHHGVRILDQAIVAAAKLSNRYITDRFMPDKAIDLIDTAGAAIRMDIHAKPEMIAQIDRQIIQREIELKALERDADPTSAARIEQIKKELDALKAESKKHTDIWSREKKAVEQGRQAKEDLEAAKREMEQKIRDKDFARVAELQYKIIPERQKAVAE
ncbi:MAG TPA: AAA family ATPase, partial [Planctomycetota bacterium]|nr:AAA family ATPase [Planctomycetota bacterium]